MCESLNLANKMLIREEKIGHIYVTVKSCSEGYISHGRGEYVRGLTTNAAIHSALSRAPVAAYSSPSTPGKQALRLSRLRIEVWLCLLLHSPDFVWDERHRGVEAPAEGALAMAASMCACEGCRALGSAGVESAE